MSKRQFDSGISKLESEICQTPKKTMRVILKSGAEFTVVCDQFTVKLDCFKNIVGYKITGMTENKVIYLDVQQIEAVVQLPSNKNK